LTYTLLGILFEEFLTKLDTFVADEGFLSPDEFADFVMPLATETTARRRLTRTHRCPPFHDTQSSLDTVIADVDP
jgi:hypothetical protein